jgi:hypothetical protein
MFAITLTTPVVFSFCWGVFSFFENLPAVCGIEEIIGNLNQMINYFD